MFNLDQAIAGWRRQMTNQDITSADVLDELESHLRDAIERQIALGIDAQKAFECAVQQIGVPTSLRREFGKLGHVSAVKQTVLIGVCLVFLGFSAFLSALTIAMCYPSWQDRLMASIAVFSILLVALGWRYAVPFLPLIQSGPKRWALGVGCIACGIVASSLFCGLILPHFEHDPDHMLPAIGLWAVFLIAIFACGGIGLLLDGQQRRNWGKHYV